MPKIPGRESTRKTIPIANLEIASFVMDHEEWLWRRPCAIEGCGHRLGCNPAKRDWTTCDERQVAGFAVKSGQYDRDTYPVCPCCVTKILA